MVPSAASIPLVARVDSRGLTTRAHLLDIERRLGRTDRADAIGGELEGWLVVADADFVVRAALR